MIGRQDFLKELEIIKYIKNHLFLKISWAINDK